MRGKSIGLNCLIKIYRTKAWCVFVRYFFSYNGNKKKKKKKKKNISGEAAYSFFASFLGSKKEVGNGGNAPNTPT